jgi:hypothetical protein
MTPSLIGPGSVRYSSIRANNGKWILAQAENGFNALYKRINGEFVRALPGALNHSAQVVFDRHDPNLLIYCDGNALMMYDVQADISDTLHLFNEYERLVSHHAEGDLSETSHLALCGVKSDGTKEVFLYDAQRGVPSQRYLAHDFDGIKAAGSHLLISNDAGIYDLTSGQPLTEANGHAAVTGKYLIWCSNARRDPWRNAVELIEIENPDNVRVLMDFGKLNYAMHLSASHDTAYCSVYDPDGILPYQIWELPFSGGKKLLYEWSAPYIGYDSQPRATWSDGLLCFNKDGAVWTLDTDVVVPAVPMPAKAYIPYGPYAGRSEFVIEPQEECVTCHSTVRGIYERVKS